MKNIIVTNNPMVHTNYAGHDDIIYLENFAYLDVLKAVRDKIHFGHSLLTHPLSGSVKPGETPYKTVVLTGTRNGLDLDSLTLIEDGIMTAYKLIGRKKQRNWTERVLLDFQMIDYSLIFSK